MPIGTVYSLGWLAGSGAMSIATNYGQSKPILAFVGIITIYFVTRALIERAK